MRLLADENQHPLVVARLRAAGYTVEFVRETSPGARDEDILGRPDIGSMVLLTYDRDFGDLVFRRGLPQPFAIIYVRLNRVQPDPTAARLLATLEQGVSPRSLIVISEAGERIRPFPTGAEHD